jgi:serine/threonine protein kinase
MVRYIYMPAKHIPCGPTVNQSEDRAIERLKNLFNNEWVLLTNLNLITGQDWQPSDIDILAVGAGGVLVIEVKHWDSAWLQENQDLGADASRILKSKTERMGSFLRRALPGIDLRARQFFLFTKESTQAPPTMLAGAPIWTLKSSQTEVGKLTDKLFSPAQVTNIVTAIEPKARLQTDGKIRSFGDYQNMELVSSLEDRFHRIYKAQHRRNREKVILHLYDLSDTQDKDPRRLAEREFRVLQELQKCRYVPRTRDSFQDLAAFPGEVCMFSIFDPGAPSLKKRSSDQKWTTEERIRFACDSADALAEMQGMKNLDDTQIVHRNLSPYTILVGAKNRPILIGFDVARAAFTRTLPSKRIEAQPPEWVAPELAGADLSKASIYSDVYALCASLKTVLEGIPAAQICCAKGLTKEPESRITALELKAEFQQLLTPQRVIPEKPAESLVPRAEFWCEGTEIPFKGRNFEILECLGAGGIGRTYKVAELNPKREEGYYGIFVAKVIFNQDAGENALQAYRRARQHSQHSGLATIFEIADEWEPDKIMVLLQWVERESLSGLRDGLVGLAVQECGLSSIAALCKIWLKDTCEALAALHSQRLVHGDVSPRNIIYSPERLVLTDYDLIRQSGKAGWTHGALPFCSPEAEQNEAITGSDDVYALAASLYSVIFDTDAPFRHSDGSRKKAAGLCWSTDSREVLEKLTKFFDKATHPDRSRRFSDALEALQWLEQHSFENTSVLLEEPTLPPPIAIAAGSPKAPNVVPWLDSLLSVYPGSPRGNIETRGLDSEFAAATYVRTALEVELVNDIKSRKLRLLILCGNAGDGKTALLQRIGHEFGAGNIPSEQRVWSHVSPDGLNLKANLDGSAAWKESSADQLLDEILLPFLDGYPAESSTHLLAINDGRLLQWLTDKLEAGKEGELLDALKSFLSHDDDAELPDHLRFISLNHRSLIGGQTGDGARGADFINELITALLGGELAPEIWKPCLSCTAWDRCTAGPMAHLLIDQDNARSSWIRKRLHETLQAVHQRGNVHITARELRGVLSYLLFGVRSCTELHSAVNLEKSKLRPVEGIGEMAFNPESPFRQGDLLREMTELDPALEANSQLDRQLLAAFAAPLGIGPDAARAHLATVRRSAFFEWSADQLEVVAGNDDALRLAGGHYLSDFRQASEADAEQNAIICERLVRGISHLEDIPPLALQRIGRVALRLPSRTPTETKFWVELELARFRLEPDLPANLDKAIPRLARQLRLTFVRNSDEGEETLLMGYQLFAILLQLESGEQLADTRSDDLFANLQIFTQRLAQESSRSLFAWNPKEDGSIFSLNLEARGDYQALALTTEPKDQKP